MASDQIGDLKTMLGISDNDQDSMLNLIIKHTESSLKVKLGLKSDKDVPDELAYIVTEVSVRRFNRLKNEGMQSYSQEGESITYKSSDFDDFLSDIDEYKAQKNNRGNSFGTMTAINPYHSGDAFI